MAADEDDQDHSRDRSPGQAARAAQISLFRPGQPRIQLPVALDQRTGREISISPAVFAAPNPSRIWESISELQVDPAALVRNGLFLKPEHHTITRYFDMLRTRIAQAMAKEGMSRLAITSPTSGCGKSFVAANLALSLGRLPSCRTVLLDLELRRPRLASLFAQASAPALIDFLNAEQPLEAQFRRIGPSLALGLNGEKISRPAETLQDPTVLASLQVVSDLLQPDIQLFDTPPALEYDDMIALTGQVDAVLLVVDGTRTTAAEITACERMFENRIPLLAVVLNRAQDRGLLGPLSGGPLSHRLLTAGAAAAGQLSALVSRILGRK
ncbi:CpsD/CapB family tyrosine-protein kinase [Xinfangfangia sp. D13-10-4-6]|uniref:CpsD/CapB family tyrosine-protein kinase n=1 Tax=Pseudogemmobacter hezensis TaxID=2737662 RepID=UPI001552B0C3|nr:CpsD/CapB family tyrosine-protein kinase [Pseudogemmobacter hezensis]NPD13871.1 CpsD/CapB family tyrosine-protein kinase [Pseudogemmobacter hezensis]